MQTWRLQFKVLEVVEVVLPLRHVRAFFNVAVPPAAHPVLRMYQLEKVG